MFGYEEELQIKIKILKDILRDLTELKEDCYFDSGSFEVSGRFGFDDEKIKSLQARARGILEKSE
jgi:hypothetical protein